MHKLLPLALAFLIQAPAIAQTASPAITGPTEIGTTTMAAGQYQVTDKTSGKVYDLMVTGKGNMILSPSAGSGAATSATSVTSAAAAAPAAPSVLAPVSAVVAPVAGAAAVVAAPAAAATTAATGAVAGSTNALNSLVNQGMQRGMNELMKRGATNQLKNLVK